MDEQLHQILVTKIVPSRWQPRERFDAEALLELAKHIKDHGLMYPIILFVNEDGEYELVAGERRTRAVAALDLIQNVLWVARHGNGLRTAVTYVAEHGWTDLPDDVKTTAITRIAARIEADGSDHRRLHELAVADNIQRENLSPLEEARALHDLMQEYNLSQRDVAAQIGWSQSKIAQRLALLNLAPETREALSTRVLSPSHARHIASCPIEIQPAVTQYVGTMVARDGDQAATVRQVAAFIQQLRRFLNPQRWLPPDGETIQPQRRNILRLMHYVVSSVDLSQLGRGEAILQLRSFSNLLGKKTTSLDRVDMARIIEAMTGLPRNLDAVWTAIAQAQGWTCEHCQFHGLQPPAQSEFQLPCMRWRSKKLDSQQAWGTCIESFAGPDDPFIIPIHYDLMGWAKDLESAALITEPFLHFTDYESWNRLVEEASKAQAAEQQKIEQARQIKHIVALAGYWQAQQVDGLFAAGIEHPQAHRCDRCIYFRPDLLDQDLPPCEFAICPFSERYSDDPVPPDFGVLVRQDGLIVPRCMHFRLARVAEALHGMTGFRLPDRKVAMAWFHAVMVNITCARNARDSTLGGPLAWLPYSRPERKDVHNLDNLLRYLSFLWDEFNDEVMATLLTAAVLEAQAMERYRGSFELLHPTELVPEQWASVAWNTVTTRRKPGGYDGYPENWPMPWVETE